LRYLGEQRRFLRAANGQWSVCRNGGAKALNLGAAQLARNFDFRAVATTPHRTDIERHRVVARAQNNSLRALSHVVLMCRTALD
jgi:hypothetical protein